MRDLSDSIRIGSHDSQVLWILTSNATPEMDI